MIPISEEDKAQFESLIPEDWEPDDGLLCNALYRIAKAAIEFNKTAVPVFHITEGDRNLAREALDPSHVRHRQSWFEACMRITKAALDAQAKAQQNAPKLTDINWAGLCDEKVWETQLSQGHWGNATRGRWIAEQFRTCRDFAFSSHGNNRNEAELKTLKSRCDMLTKENELITSTIRDYRMIEDRQLTRIRELEAIEVEFQQQLATVKEQANKPKVIRRF